MSGCRAVGGGGLAVTGLSSIRLSAFSIHGNSLTSLDSDSRSITGGGGLLAQNSSIFVDDGDFSDNEIVTSASSVLGAGVAIFNSENVHLSGNISLSNNRLIVLRGSGTFFGSGLALWNCRAITILGFLSASHNRFESSLCGVIHFNGAGISISKSSNVHIAAHLTLTSNLATAACNNSGMSFLFGGGISFSDSENIVFSGDMHCQSNSISVSGKYADAKGGGIFMANISKGLFLGNWIVSLSTMDIVIFGPNRDAQYQKIFSEFFSSGGAALFIMDAASLIFSSTFQALSCSIGIIALSNDTNQLLGGAVSFYRSSNLSFTAGITILDTVVSAVGPVSLYGAGISAFEIKSFALLGSTVVADNRMQTVSAQSELSRGGGINLSDLTGFLWDGTALLFRNSIQTDTNNALVGGGLSFLRSSNIQTQGLQLTVLNNSILASAKSQMFGGGICIIRNSPFSFNGLVVEGNVLDAPLQSDVGVGEKIPEPVQLAVNNACGDSSLKDTSGILSVFLDVAVPRKVCQWKMEVQAHIFAFMISLYQSNCFSS